MDSTTTSPGDPLAATLHNAIIDKAERNEFSNSARDMFKIVLNYHQNSSSAVPSSGAAQAVENPVSEFHDAINYLINAVPIFVEEVRKTDQSQPTVGETAAKDSSDSVHQAVTTDTPHSSIPENPVDVTDMVPQEPSLLPVANVADRYTRSMLKCLLGYPLYNPKPFSELSTEYPHNGVMIGDVGYVRGTGTFDFLFNICPSQNEFINPPNLPYGFSLETPEQSATTILEPLPPNTRLFQNPITKTRSGEYICEGSEGAVLELPKGAIQSEATNIRPFEKLAARHGVQWYEYTMARGRSISNGSLYLITSVIKCNQWGIGVFDRPCAPGQGLKFDKKRSLPFGKSTSKYHWKGSGAFHTKVSDLIEGDVTNQCVFVRGYKIMIRQDIFDNICNDQPRSSDSAIPSSSPRAGSTSMRQERATRIRGGGGPDPGLKLSGAGLLSHDITAMSDKEVMLHPNFHSSLLHPSDLINAALLSQDPGAKVALTHDDVWCNLLRDNFPKLNYATLINVARSYTHTIERDCVYLEKISNVLEDSSHPLLGTRTVALQGSLLPPDDDGIPVPTTISLPLPRELVERIILLLDTRCMLKCRLVDREFNGIVQSSTSVQYYLACKAAGVVDNSRSPLSYAERLGALKKREDAWRKLKPVFEMTFKVDDHMFGTDELLAGYIFLKDQNRKDLYYSHLPSSLQDGLQWIKIPCCGPAQSWSGTLIGSGMAVYEHDLIVNVICSEVGNQARSIDLVLLKLSTREYHPFARRPLIHIQRSPSAQREPSTDVKIAGDNLALVLHDMSGSKLFIFDWKTGHKQLQHNAIENTYRHSGSVFVSPELLLVPNRNLSHFEVWKLFPSHPNPKPPIQILSLQLPTVSSGHFIGSFECYGELSPVLHSMPYFPPRPFFPSLEDSLITITIVVQTKPLVYILVLHRRLLLDMIQKLTTPSLLEQQLEEGLPTWLSNEVTVHEVTDPDDGSVRLRAQSELVSTIPHPGSAPRTRGSPILATSRTSTTSTTPIFHDPTNSSSTSTRSWSSTSRYDILQVQWADWGPPISRWFHIKAGSSPMTLTVPRSTGQRCVFLDCSPRDKGKYTILVADFNPHNIRRNAEMMAQLRGREDEDNWGNVNNGEEKKEDNDYELEILEHEGGFSEEVYMGLKCMVYHLPNEYELSGVMMDEERLLGMLPTKFNHESRTDEQFFKVLYFG